MEYLILGLLILSPMTGYELQQAIKKNLALICSHSAGSIQTALTKLEKAGSIAGAETMTGKRRKKVFSVTEAGRSAFAAWSAQPMRADKVKNMELAHLFFAGLAQPEVRLAAIRDYLGQLEKIQGVLCAIRDHAAHLPRQDLPPGVDWPQVLRFQHYTLDYGLAAVGFELDWYRRLLCELEEEL